MRSCVYALAQFAQSCYYVSGSSQIQALDSNDQCRKKSSLHLHSELHVSGCISSCTRQGFPLQWKKQKKGVPQLWNLLRLSNIWPLLQTVSIPPPARCCRRSISATGATPYGRCMPFFSLLARKGSGNFRPTLVSLGRRKKISIFWMAITQDKPLPSWQPPTADPKGPLNQDYNGWEQFPRKAKERKDKRLIWQGRCFWWKTR